MPFTITFLIDPRIQVFPEEYDAEIPQQTTLAEFVLAGIAKFGDQLACVSSFKLLLKHL